MTDKLDTGHAPTPDIGAAPTGVLAPVALPTVLVFTDVASLADSLRHHESEPPVERHPMATERGAAVTAPPAPAPATNGHTVAPVDGSVQAPVGAPPSRPRRSNLTPVPRRS